jgi:hypothetical protein
MEKFVERHQTKILGVVSCFDRLIFKGYLRRVSFPSAMEWFLNSQGVLFKDFKPFVLQQSKRIKLHAESIATKAGRPFQYLNRPIRKEERAREIALKDGITRGLVCVFSQLEPCRTYRVRYSKPKPRLASDRRKCLFIYFYFIDREFGLMHIRIQTWFPFQLQVYINGHNWLANKMDRHRLGYERIDNVFTWLEDPSRAQRLADKMVRQNWPRILEAFARRVNPLLRVLFRGQRYYWVTDQSEFATDIIFESRASLQELYPELLKHATVCLSAEDILTFLGRKLYPGFKGEVHNDYKRRIPGVRVKHRMKDNWMKMYDKHGCVLRIETVINHPYEFKIRRKGVKDGRLTLGWFPMCKRVTNLWRYREVSLAANSRYLDALSSVNNIAEACRCLHRACKRIRLNGRSVGALNPLASDDLNLFRAVLRGEHNILGFRNLHVRQQLFGLSQDREKSRRQSAQTSRLFKRLHAHCLIAKIPRTRRWRVTKKGYAIMTTAIHLGSVYFPEALMSKAA